MENVLRRPPRTRACLAVPRVKFIRNHERYEKISEPTAAKKRVAVNGEEIDSLPRHESPRDPLRTYIALRLRSVGCGGMQNIYKKHDLGYVEPI
jgi:hypothetical protein